MLVICEDCAKKYNIDENRIKGRRARFTCNECGHIIIIDKADIARPLFHKQEHEEFSSSTTIDLLREMEIPFGADTEEQTPDTSEHPSQQESNEPEIPLPGKKAKRATSITGFFLLGSLFSFLIITAGISYLYTDFIAGLLSRQVDIRADLIVHTFMVLGSGWILVFLLLFCLARIVSRSIVRLTDDTNRIAMGEHDRQIMVGGPREVKELAQVIKRLTKRPDFP